MERVGRPGEREGAAVARGLSLVVYAARVGRLASFYGAVLDLPVVRPDASFAVVDGDGWELVVHAVPAPLLEGLVLADPPEVREETPVKAVLPVADLAAARVRAAASGHGGRVFGAELEWVFGDTVRCDGVDPEGNVFQLSQSLLPPVTRSVTRRPTSG